VKTQGWVIALAAAAASVAAGRPSGPAAEADGMRLYYLAFLRPDPGRRHLEQEEAGRIQAAHMANIQRMAQDGVLMGAGPMEDKPTTISGIFILRAATLAEAQGIAALDPTVTERRNTADVHPWLGPKGIGDGYFRWSRGNPGAKAAMAAHEFCILRRGAAWVSDPQADQEHARFIESLRLAGALAAAGPVFGDTDICSICVFKTSSQEEARRAMGRDPGVMSGRLAAEFHRWWCADGVLPW
jgi:uncharacterized protein YciI